jgi:hypothetical protein
VSSWGNCDSPSKSPNSGNRTYHPVDGASVPELHNTDILLCSAHPPAVKRTTPVRTYNVLIGAKAYSPDLDSSLYEITSVCAGLLASRRRFIEQIHQRFSRGDNGLVAFDNVLRAEVFAVESLVGVIIGLHCCALQGHAGKKSLGT